MRIIQFKRGGESALAVRRFSFETLHWDRVADMRKLRQLRDSIDEGGPGCAGRGNMRRARASETNRSLRGNVVLPVHQPSLKARSDDPDQQPELSFWELGTSSGTG